MLKLKEEAGEEPTDPDEEYPPRWPLCPQKGRTEADPPAAPALVARLGIETDSPPDHLSAIAGLT